jgi:hypothetical protein
VSAKSFFESQFVGKRNAEDDIEKAAKKRKTAHQLMPVKNDLKKQPPPKKAESSSSDEDSSASEEEVLPMFSSLWPILINYK